jgi:hypothetical protein
MRIKTSSNTVNASQPTVDGHRVDHPAPQVLGSTRSWVNILTKYIDSLESIMLHFVDPLQDYCSGSRPNPR